MTTPTLVVEMTYPTGLEESLLAAPGPLGWFLLGVASGGTATLNVRRAKADDAELDTIGEIR